MNEIKYAHIWSAILETPWAILPSKMTEITDFLAFKSAGGSITIEEVRDRFDDSRNRKQPQSPSRIGVMPVYGTISKRAGLLSMASGGTSVEGMTGDFRAFLNDPEIDAIVMDIDSPGGAVSGLTEFADEIYRARRTKPVIAVANSLMASGAYWLASAASEIVASPSAKLGSIGVIMAHQNQQAAMEKLGVDISLVSAGKYKAENNPFEPLTDEGRAEIQKRVDESYGMFTRDIARGRGILVQTVRDGFGQGRIVGARESVDLGMADRIGTIDEVIAEISSSKRAGTSDAKAGLVAFPYEEHGLRVLADIDLFAQATRDRIDYRRLDGRGLSPAQRDQLTLIQSGLSEAASRIEAMLAETDPERVIFNPLMLRARRSVSTVLAAIETGGR